MEVDKHAGANVFADRDWSLPQATGAGEDPVCLILLDPDLVLPRLLRHIAPRGAKKEEAFGGVILKSERPSGALFTNSGPPFFTVESKIEVLSPLGTSFH